LGGHIFENNRAFTSLQGYGSLARGGLPFPANDAFHNNLLVLKSGFQMSKSGTYAVII
jgi:hypothetical protein